MIASIMILLWLLTIQILYSLLGQQNSDALNGRWRKKVIHSVVEIASEMSPENRLRSNSLLSSLKQNVIKQTNGMTTRLLTSSLFSGKSNANRMIKVPSQRSKSVQNTPEKSKLKFQKPNSKSRKVFFSGLVVASMLVTWKMSYLCLLFYFYEMLSLR